MKVSTFLEVRSAWKGLIFASCLQILLPWPAVLAFNPKWILEGAEQVAKHGDEVVDAARLLRATGQVAAETVAADAARLVGLEDNAAQLAGKVALTTERIQKMGQTRSVLTWNEAAAKAARSAVKNGDLESVAEALAYLKVSQAEMRQAEVLRFSGELSAEQTRALLKEMQTQNVGLTNLSVLKADSRTRKEILPLAIEIYNTHDQLVTEFAQICPLLTGTRGEAPQQAALKLMERLERNADAWRWMSNAYGVEGKVKLPFQIREQVDLETMLKVAEGALPPVAPSSAGTEAAQTTRIQTPEEVVGEQLGNARAYLGVARGEEKLPEIAIREGVVKPTVEMQAATSQAVPPAFPDLVDLATRERRLVTAERQSVVLSPWVDDVVQVVENVLLDEDDLRARVKVVRKDWAAAMPEGVLTFCATALITLLALSAGLIILCPILLAAAWASLFRLRRNKLKLELYSSGGETALPGRMEIGGVAKLLCQLSGQLAQMCPWAASVLLVLVVASPVGLVFAEQSEGLPGFWNLVVASLGIVPVFFTAVFCQEIWQKRKTEDLGSFLVTGLFALGFIAITVVLLRWLVSPRLIYNPNFWFAVTLLPLGFGARRCAAQFARLGQMRSPDAKDFDALILRTFARDADASPVVMGMGFEEALCGFLQRRGLEALAVGQPWEVFPGGAAARVYLPMHGWEQFVIRYVRLARIILVIPGDSQAVIWEQGVLKTFGQGGKVIILCPYETPADRHHYDAFRDNMQGKLDLPAISQSGIIRFDAAWNARFIPLKLSGYATAPAFYDVFEKAAGPF